MLARRPARAIASGLPRPVLSAGEIDRLAARHRFWHYRAGEAGMSDLLGELALQDLGVAWLPDSGFHGGRLTGLLPLGDGACDATVEIVAYSSRAHTQGAVVKAWERIVQTA